MNISDARFLCDENIHPDVVDFLSSLGHDTVTTRQTNLLGKPDDAVLDRAASESRFVLTHDADFGQLAVRDRRVAFGIVYLRPGHIEPRFVVDSLAAWLRSNFTLEPPTIIVIDRRSSEILIRVRPL